MSVLRAGWFITYGLSLQMVALALSETAAVKPRMCAISTQKKRPETLLHSSRRLLSSFFSGNRKAKFLKIFRKKARGFWVPLAATQQFSDGSRPFAARDCLVRAVLSLAAVSRSISKW